MNRDFEFSQLLRAYRRGIITEATFESEMAELERGAGANGSGFSVNGKSYPSERAAVIEFVDNLRANEFRRPGLSEMGGGVQDRLYPQRACDDRRT